jgi:hypothetical protein
VLFLLYEFYCGYDPPKKKFEQFLGLKENPSINSTPKLAILLEKDANFFYITKG